MYSRMEMKDAKGTEIILKLWHQVGRSYTNFICRSAFGFGLLFFLLAAFVHAVDSQTNGFHAIQNIFFHFECAYLTPTVALRCNLCCFLLKWGKNSDDNAANGNSNCKRRMHAEKNSRFSHCLAMFLKWNILSGESWCAYA